MIESPRARTAYHEAGHVVIAHLFGRSVGPASIVPGRTYSGVMFHGRRKLELRAAQGVVFEECVCDALDRAGVSRHEFACLCAGPGERGRSRIERESSRECPCSLLVRDP